MADSIDRTMIHLENYLYSKATEAAIHQNKLYFNMKIHLVICKVRP